ncbi:MAG TPA: methyltransferase domain-containing protein [Mesorhizobium sp.]|nr:methyltransferase domain-containing protein [Mesorhizobium sp.]
MADAAQGKKLDEIRGRNYDAVARIYEELAHVYSLGLIRKAKLVELRYIKPGDRVLYLGVGSGEDALAAARAGAKVTAIDLSPRMVGRLRDRLARRGLDAELIASDALKHRPEAPYDAVCGNYFFNLFNSQDMPVVLRHAATLVKPGGRLMIADMAPPKGFGGALSWLYLKFGLTFFWALRLAAQHPIYDYAAHGRAEGLETEAVHDFRAAGLTLYRTVILKRPSAEEPG